MHVDRLRYLQADGQRRIERGHRLLEDHRDLVAAHRADAGIVELQQIDTVEQDFAALDPARRVRDQPQHRQRGDAFAGSGLAHNRERLAGIEMERHAIDRGHGSALGAESHRQIFDLQQRARHRKVPLSSPSFSSDPDRARCGRKSGRGGRRRRAVRRRSSSPTATRP